MFHLLHRSTAVKHECDDSVDNIRYPHGHKCRRKTRKHVKVCVMVIKGYN